MIASVHECTHQRAWDRRRPHNLSTHLSKMVATVLCSRDQNRLMSTWRGEEAEVIGWRAGGTVKGDSTRWAPWPRMAAAWPSSLPWGEGTSCTAWRGIPVFETHVSRFAIKCGECLFNVHHRGTPHRPSSSLAIGNSIPFKFQRLLLTHSCSIHSTPYPTLGKRSLLS
jgi:hypothetical protein